MLKCSSALQYIHFEHAQGSHDRMKWSKSKINRLHIRVIQGSQAGFQFHCKVHYIQTKRSAISWSLIIIMYVCT
uniref:Uncharacterized protein n=1 Tax=Anguilla anguilla TaxID=7936 RepID=A0A0E9WKR8_ANGAN